MLSTISVSDGTNSQVLVTKTETENSDGSKTATDAYANGQAVSATTDLYGRTDKIEYNDGSATTLRYDYSYSSADNTSNDLDGEEITTVEDYSTGQKTTSSKSDDPDSFNQQTVVTDLATLAILYSYSVVNTENDITLTTDIAGTSQSYTYSKDSAGRLYRTTYTLPDMTAVTKQDSFGVYGQTTGSVLQINSVTRLQTDYTYRTISGVDFSGQVSQESIQTGANTAVYSYVYSDTGNITKISRTIGGITTELHSYVYDEASQLVREDNASSGQTTTFQYDADGNIRTKKIYPIVVEGVTPNEQNKTDEIPYTYSTGIWKDLLTSYDGQSISYDASGNPTSYLGATLTWAMGRQLASYTKNTLAIGYKYNDQGIRTRKTINGVNTDYVLSGSQILAQTTGGIGMDYRYDGNGKLIAIRYNGAEYYYVTNIQGDITGLVDSNGTSVVEYSYDAWGKVLSTTGTLAK